MGGLNVYGFASGDPITYSDPFGLCPEDSRSGPECFHGFGGGGRYNGGGGGASWGDEPSSNRTVSTQGFGTVLSLAAIVAREPARGTSRDIRIGDKVILASHGMAPRQVTPGIRNVVGWYDPPSRRGMEPYSAWYDDYGRQIGRTDFTDQPDPATHTSPHHHITVYGPGFGPKGKETGPHPGPHPFDQKNK